MSTKGSYEYVIRRSASVPLGKVHCSLQNDVISGAQICGLGFDFHVGLNTHAFKFRSVGKVFAFGADAENHAVFKPIKVRLARRAEGGPTYNLGAFIVLEGHDEVLTR